MQCFLKPQAPLLRPNTLKNNTKPSFSRKKKGDFSPRKNKWPLATYYCQQSAPSVFRSLEVILRNSKPLCSAIMLLTTVIQMKLQ